MSPWILIAIVGAPDLGSARLEGPRSVEVMSTHTWTLVYAAGPTGIRPGGGVRVGLRHLHCWSPPQATNPSGLGYVTVKAARDIPIALSIAKDGKRFFGPYFPWQNMLEVTFPTDGLRPGERLRITFGDPAGGSPGMRVQPFDEERFEFKTFVDPRGKGEYLPLAESPCVAIRAAAAHRLAAVLPSEAVVGQPTWCLVRAEDRYGNPAARYRGTIRWEASDSGATLPGAHSFVAADRGAHRFEEIRFRAAGIQTIRIDDGTYQAASNPVRVTRARPQAWLLWGDLHGHTLHSDGRGTVEAYYRFARDVAGLDFCAVSDHAFEILDDAWTHSKAVTNRFNEPGRFVTFQAFEWSGLTRVGGDHNVYFLEDDPPIFRSESYYDPRNLQMVHSPEAKVNHIQGIFAKLAERYEPGQVLCIPHFGGRRGNPAWHDPAIQRLIEIFSEHRRSEDWATTFLEKGHRVGIMASTDNHFGNPGHGYLKPTYDWATQEIGMAAVAVCAPERTRESIFRALYARRTYATSGDRILLDVRADGHPMGSALRSDEAPTIAIEVIGTAPITRVEIKKDGRPVATRAPDAARFTLRWRDPEFRADRPCTYYVRIAQENGEEAISSPVWVN